MRILRTLLAVICISLVASVASATTVVIPNIFSNGQVIDATMMNSNFSALSAWAYGNVDNTNIGASGIFASQIIPDSSAHATFGGAQTYIFPAAVSMTNAFTQTGGTVSIGGSTTFTLPLLVNPNGAGASYVAPTFVNNGAPVASTWHHVVGTAFCGSVGSCTATETFATPFLSTPICNGTWTGGDGIPSGGLNRSTTAVAMTFGAGHSPSAFDYDCQGP